MGHQQSILILISQSDCTDYVNAYKKIINWAGQLGISVMGILTIQSMGKSNLLKPKQTRDLNDFDQNFVPRFLNTFTWHVQTYPNVEGWEIWNEPGKRGIA